MGARRRDEISIGDIVSLNNDKTDRQVYIHEPRYEQYLRRDPDPDSSNLHALEVLFARHMIPTGIASE